METWDYINGNTIKAPKEMEEFINKIIKLEKEYNLTISHEDSHGAFLIEKYDEINVNWLKDAMKNY